MKAAALIALGFVLGVVCSVGVLGFLIIAANTKHLR